MLFSEALGEFPDGSIDLLHIDGLHTYDDVKDDFESWLPKLSQNGVILFHDVILRDRGFGVWKLWDEIAWTHNSFLFEFGFGLGLWKKEPLGKTDCPLIRKLLSASEAERLEINRSYANAAVALALWERFREQSDPKLAATARREALDKEKLIAGLRGASRARTCSLSSSSDGPVGLRLQTVAPALSCRDSRTD